MYDDDIEMKKEKTVHMVFRNAGKISSTDVTRREQCTKDNELNISRNPVSRTFFRNHTKERAMQLLETNAIACCMAITWKIPYCFMQDSTYLCDNIATKI
jgi:hypothetical protein